MLHPCFLIILEQAATMKFLHCPSCAKVVPATFSRCHVSEATTRELGRIPSSLDTDVNEALEDLKDAVYRFHGLSTGKKKKRRKSSRIL